MELADEEEAVEAVKSLADANEQDRAFVGETPAFFDGEAGVRRMIMLMREKKLSPYLLGKLKGIATRKTFGECVSERVGMTGTH